MSDRSWMLNLSAINAARNCISIVQRELGVKLKLSHPQFIEMLNEYTELTDNKELKKSLSILLQFSDEVPVAVEKKKVSNMTGGGFFGRAKEASSNVSPAPAPAQGLQVVSEENMSQFEVDEEEAAVAPATVECQGKLYPKYNSEGKEFKGLYRGQPRYS